MFGPLSFPSSPSGNEANGSMKLSPCMLCEEKFDLNYDREDFMNHILEAHSVIIKDCDCIIDLASYVNYWKDKFKTVNIKDICCPVESKDTNSTESSCYILSDGIKEDKDLREKLNKHALEKALDRQKCEREDKQFKRRCLFCRHDIEPTRAIYLSHLSTAHNLQLGKPDNLVFIDKYLDVIETKIENLKCIFCEKTFKDRNVLKEHMRKKLHKRVNPRNPIYDQFYMVNYLAPGLSNKKLRERKRRKSLDDDDNCDWSDWKEESMEPIVCLFCTDNFLTWDSVLQHVAKDHSFDFKSLSSELNFYEQVKLVNFIRRQIYRNQCITCDRVLSDRKELLSHMTEEKHFLKPPKEKWDQPEYFFPTYENDGFLYYLDDSSEQNMDSDEENVLSDNEHMSHFVPSKEKSLPCLFCDFSHNIGDNLLQHMYDEHEFDYNEYTRPLNFLERVKLINYTQQQIKNKLCIECDKKFDDLQTLVNHMKLENHFNTPPKKLWQQEKYSSTSGTDQGKSNNIHEDTVDYLYALESLNNIKKDLDIEKEVKDNCFSDCDEDAVPIVCLYCDNESSSWTQVLSHLETVHNFPYVSLTSDLSFYDQVKMVTYLRKMIKKLTCPVCGVLCKKEELLNHFESKKHFSIPPKSLWDKSEFYPASFAGDPFLSELNVHHATDSLTAAQSTNNEVNKQNDIELKEDEDSGSDWGDWDEEMKIPVMCLLCKDVSQNWLDVHSHMKNKHNFSYHEISSGLMFYDQVKLVNYLRFQVSSNKCFVCDNSFETNDKLLDHYRLEKHLRLPEKQLWDKDKFFQPFLENDGFLAHIDDGDSDDGI